MKPLPLETALLFVSTTAVGYVMITAGIEKKALEWRQRRRTCPGCGKHLRGHSVCTCSQA